MRYRYVPLSMLAVAQGDQGRKIDGMSYPIKRGQNIKERHHLDGVVCAIRLVLWFALLGLFRAESCSRCVRHQLMKVEYMRNQVCYSVDCMCM